MVNGATPFADAVAKQLLDAAAEAVAEQFKDAGSVACFARERLRTPKCEAPVSYGAGA
jgi:hypothetical protein